jgi:hypothetical protein
MSETIHLRPQVLGFLWLGKKWRLSCSIPVQCIPCAVPAAYVEHTDASEDCRPRSSTLRILVTTACVSQQSGASTFRVDFYPLPRRRGQCVSPKRRSLAIRPNGATPFVITSAKISYLAVFCCIKAFVNFSLQFCPSFSFFPRLEVFFMQFESPVISYLHSSRAVVLTL